MKKILAILLSLIMIISLCACGAKKSEAKTFTMGIDPEYPPFSYLGDDGEYTGFDVDICKAACELLGWEFKVFGVNWDDKLIQLDANECDCIWSGMTLLDSMSEAGYVLSAPYFDNTQVIMVKEGSDIKSSADLAGKVVGVQTATSAYDLLQDEEGQKALCDTFASLEVYETYTVAFTALQSGAIDAIAIDVTSGNFLMSDTEGYKFLDEALGSEQYAIGFRKGDEALCNKVNEALQALVNDGTYAEIGEKYPDIKDFLCLEAK